MSDLGVDCISRVDALALYCDKCGVYNCISKCASYRAVEKMPPVTPREPRKGHWIDDISLGYHVSICSNCNWKGHGDTHLIYKPKYCPNCGAKMVEPQESEDA